MGGADAKIAHQVLCFLRYVIMSILQIEYLIFRLLFLFIQASTVRVEIIASVVLPANIVAEVL